MDREQVLIHLDILLTSCPRHIYFLYFAAAGPGPQRWVTTTRRCQGEDESPRVRVRCGHSRHGFCGQVAFWAC